MRKFAAIVALGAGLVALLSLAAVTSAAAHRQSTALGAKRCPTIHGPRWTQTINAANSSKQKAHLRVLHGRRYYVFVNYLPCAWASRVVLRLIRIGIPWRVRQASPAGYVCQVGDNNWFRDPFNGDAVRQSEPVSAYGACTRPEAPGFSYHTFWWSPAKRP